MSVNINWDAIVPQPIPLAFAWHPYPKWKPLFPAHYLVTLQPKDYQEEAIVAISWWCGDKFSKEYGQDQFIVTAFQSLPAPYLFAKAAEEEQKNEVK